MRVITLWQPWATWILWGWRTIETRTHNRFACLKGELIGIHAGKKFDHNAIGMAQEYLTTERIVKHNESIYPLGYIIATAQVTDARRLDFIHSEKALIECYTERYGLFLENIMPTVPVIKYKGSQGIWNFRD